MKTKTLVKDSEPSLVRRRQWHALVSHTTKRIDNGAFIRKQGKVWTGRINWR